MIRRRSHRKSVSQLVIKPRFPDLPLNPIITRPSFLSFLTLFVKYLTNWAMFYGNKKPSVHPAAGSQVTPTIGFLSMSQEHDWEIAFPAPPPHQATYPPSHRVLPPSLRLVLLSHTTFPWSLATAHLTAPHSSIWISSAAPIIFGGVGLLTLRVGVWLVGADLQGWWCGAFSESTWNKKWGHSMHRLAKSYPSYFKQKEEKRL